MEANGLPSRTAILTAAARAFGSREPDASVRNPDWAADRLKTLRAVTTVSGPVSNL